MPWLRTVSVWDDSPTRRVLRLVERRPSGGPGDYDIPIAVALLPSPPYGWQRQVNIRLDFSEKPVLCGHQLVQFPIPNARPVK